MDATTELQREHQLVRRLQRDAAEMKRYIYHGPKRDRTVLNEFGDWLESMRAAVLGRRVNGN